MSTVLLCRDGAIARFLAHEIATGHTLAAIIVESGRDARRRKLRRAWQRTPWWKGPLFLLDLAALAVYGRLWATVVRRKTAGHPSKDGYPAGVPLVRVDDANSEVCVEALREVSAEVLVVLGTSILRPPLLDVAPGTVLNIHGGIVPEYRNVHSELWAVLNGDVENVGTSIIHLDDGIDSGEVALQGRVEAAKGYFDLRWRNVELSARLIGEALDRIEEGTLPSTPQDESRKGFYPTPGVGELLKLAFTRVRM